MKLTRDDVDRIKSALDIETGGRPITVAKIVTRIEALRDSISNAEDRELKLNPFVKRNPTNGRRRKSNR